MLKELTGGDLVLDFQGLDLSDAKEEKIIIGQDKAMEALALGFAIDRPGYNIFVSGDEGTARLTAVKEEIGKIESDVSGLMDVAYAYNAKHENNPVCLIFKKGMARTFARKLQEYGKRKISKETLLEGFDDVETERFVSSLPPMEENPDSYRINIILDRTSTRRRPLVIESHPSHDSLFGFINKDKAPHLAIEIGSYQMALGGFLVINAEELLSEKGLWTTLKRYIDMSDKARFSTAVAGELMGTVRPSAIPLSTKVILIGNDATYDELAEKDGQFLKLFKISPEFDYQMPASRENILATVGYLRRVANDLLPISDNACKELLRYSSWFAENRNMLSTQLSMLGDVVEESYLEAVNNGEKRIEGRHVRSAIKKRNRLAALTEEKINQEIKEGGLLINLTGEKIGMVNGLAVMDRGLSSFGTPTVITATVAPGTEGIVNIEHEAGLSGGIHDKGLLILEGYLRHRYARTFPLSLYAGICFEQSYAEVDGDSASSAELYALLSAIGEIPIRQDIAITGSVNQMGQLQPVGGINEKIEGFYNACLTSGLTGKQGVIIPKQNISSLILPYEVEDAVRAGAFHIYSISEIDEGFELISGLKAGERNMKGQFPAGSFNRMIEDSLKRLCSSSQKN